MNYELNSKIKNLEPYEPISGEYDIRLDANECPHNYPDFILNEINKEIKNINFNRYPDPLATSVVNAFANYYNINSNFVTAGNGSDELIFIIESAFLQKNEKMLVCEPDFSMYKFYSSICETVGMSFIKDDSLKIDVEKLISYVNQNDIKLLIFSNPCNPTGQGLSAKEVRKLVSSVNALVVLDEAYMDFWNESLIGEVQNYSNLIVFRTASKSVGSAGLRLGFAVANETITRAIKAVKSPYNVNSISQTIGTIIYKNKEYLQIRQKEIVTNTKKLYNRLVEIGNKTDDFLVYPTCANFVFIKTSLSKDIYNYLKENRIAIRLMGGYIRITCGTQSENEKVIKCVTNFLLR